MLEAILSQDIGTLLAWAYFTVALLIFWVYAVAQVMKEIRVLRTDPEYERPKVPRWKALQFMAQLRIMRFVAILLAPLLVVIWGLTLITLVMWVVTSDLLKEEGPKFFQNLKSTLSK